MGRTSSWCAQHQTCSRQSLFASVLSREYSEDSTIKMVNTKGSPVDQTGNNDQALPDQGSADSPAEHPARVDTNPPLPSDLKQRRSNSEGTPAVPSGQAITSSPTRRDSLVTSSPQGVGDKPSSMPNRPAIGTAIIPMKIPLGTLAPRGSSFYPALAEMRENGETPALHSFQQAVGAVYIIQTRF